ncbi:MAG TPA: hypothetical protein VHX42_02285 [Candidatus Babeliales bacterium]|nr:hypothetical protein [Candidatus Babeliales bacterium]
MLTKLQLVVLGVVVLQGAGLSAMEKPLRSPRQQIALSCSQEARRTNSGDLTAVALKQSLELRKEEKKNYSSNFYYDSPCGHSRVMFEDQMYYCIQHRISPMAPWVPDHSLHYP